MLRTTRCRGAVASAATAMDGVKNAASIRRCGPVVLGRVQGASTDEGRNLGVGEVKSSQNLSPRLPPPQLITKPNSTEQSAANVPLRSTETDAGGVARTEGRFCAQ